MIAMNLNYLSDSMLTVLPARVAILRRIQENNSSARILYNTSFPMAGGRNNGTEPFDVFVAGGVRRFLPRCPTPTVHRPDGRGPRPQSTTSGSLLGLGTRYRAQGPP